MGFFSKKKNNENESKDEKVAGKKQTAKKNKKSDLGTIIRPSVVETALDIMDKNELFKSANDEGENVYVCLSLPTERIGGLSKKSKKEEDKGSLVELINGGSIEVYATDELVNNEELVFIPTPGTIDSMSEFSMLTAAEYDLLFVHEDGSIERTDYKVSYKDIEGILNDDDGHIDDIIGEDEEEVVSEAEKAADINLDQIEEIEDDYEEDVETLEDATYDEPVYEENYYEEPVMEEVPYVGEESVSVEDGNYYEDEMTHEEVYEEELPVEDVQDEQVDGAYRRIVEMDDLSVGYSLENFNLQFGDFTPENVPLFEIPIEAENSWLIEQVSTILTEANQDLKGLREHNRQQLQNQYTETMNRSLDHIINTYDYNNPEADVYKERKNIEEAIENTRKQSDERVKEKVNEEKARYNKERDEYANAAKLEAYRAYDDRNKKQSDEKLFRIQQEEEAIVTNERIQKLHELNQTRKDRALALQGVLESGIMLGLTDTYDKMLVDERDRRRFWQDRITHFVDSNRQHDIERAEILNRQLQEDQRVRKLEEEQKLRITQMKADFEAQHAIMVARIQELEAHQHTQLGSKDEQYKSLAEAARLREEQLKEEIVRLENKYSDLEKVKQELYDAQATRLNSERDSWKSQLEINQQQVKRTQTIIWALCIAAVIAAVFVGILIGAKLGYDTHSSKEAVANVITGTFYEALKDVPFNNLR